MDGTVGEEEEVSMLNFPLGWIVASYAVAVLGFFVTFVCFFFFGSLLANKKIRNNSYNVYIIFLILPDAINTFFETSFALSLAINGSRTFPPGLYHCIFLCYIFYFFCNFFLNAVVTYEINKLVTQSYRRQRAQPPQLTKVYKQVAGVYLYAIAFATWALVPIKWSPLYILRDGDSYKPEFGSSEEGGFSRLAGMVITYGQILLPLVYVLYVRIKIGVKKLLPNKGRTRVLSAFFMRIITVFLLFYIPNLSLATINMKVTDATATFWLIMLGRTISFVQALVTLFMIWRKDDIRKAVIQAFNMTFGRCCCEIKVAKRSPNGQSESKGTVQISGISGPVSKNIWNESDVYNSSTDRPVTSHVLAKSEWEQDDEFDDGDNNVQVTGGATHNNRVGEESTESLQYDEDEDSMEKGSLHKSVDMAGQVG